MPDSTINDTASVEAEIAEIEKAESSKTEAAEQTEVQEPSAFEALAAKKKFGSADDLAIAYENLEKMVAPQATELKELRKMMEKIQQSTSPDKKDPLKDLPPEQQEALSLIEEIISRKLSPLIKDREVQKASEKLEEVKKSFPGADDSEIDQAITLMEKYSEMTLEEAMKIATYDRTKQSTATIAKRTAIDQKNKRVFSESASSARAGDDTDYSKLSLEELEEMLGVRNR